MLFMCLWSNKGSDKISNDGSGCPGLDCIQDRRATCNCFCISNFTWSLLVTTSGYCMLFAGLQIQSHHTETVRFPCFFSIIITHSIFNQMLCWLCCVFHLAEAVAVQIVSSSQKLGYIVNMNNCHSFFPYHSSKSPSEPGLGQVYRIWTQNVALQSLIRTTALISKNELIISS